MKSRKEEKQIKDLEKEEAESMCNLRIFSDIEQRKFEEEVISGLDESNIAYSIQSE